MVLVCTAAPVVPPARDLDFFISTDGPFPAGPWASAPGAEAHAGIAFYAPYSGYNKLMAEGKKPLTRRTFALLQRDS
jgi:hypothetical protein